MLQYVEDLLTSLPEPLKKNWANDRNGGKRSEGHRRPSDCFAHGRFVIFHQQIAPLSFTIDTAMYNILSHHGEKEALSLFHRDMYSPGGSQCQVMDWIGFDGLARNQGKTDALGESGEQQMYIVYLSRLELPRYVPRKRAWRMINMCCLL